MDSTLESPEPRSLAVDTLALRERAEECGRRRFAGATRRALLRRAVALCDLTSLEGSDSEASVRALCARARQPGGGPAPDAAGRADGMPPVAAVCVHLRLVPVAVAALAGSAVRVAAVAGGFPSAQLPLSLRLAETRLAVELGADEVDVVLSRGAFLARRFDEVHDELIALREAAGDATLKVILETCELGGFERVAQAAWIACEAGADFVKTSTGKAARGADPATVLCLLRVADEYSRTAGRPVGVKVAGGVRTSADALQYLAVLLERCGPSWLTPRRFRIGASGLCGELVRDWRRLGGEAPRR